MLFSVDEDAGNRIVGWIMPDNPSHTPAVAVYEDDKKLGEIKARVMRPLLREQGLHDTGLCGFVVDSDAIPQLAKMGRLQLYDTATGLLIYRRQPRSEVVQSRLFRLDPQLLPYSRLNAIFVTHFQMSYARAELIPPQTLNSVIGIPFCDSIYIAGRVYLMDFETLLRDRGFITCASLRDPIEELAEQLLTLDWIARNDEAVLKQFGVPGLEALTDTIRPEKLASAEDFHAWLLRRSPEERWLLTDPLTRLLTCRGPDERLPVVAVSSALDALSHLSVVDERSNMERFLASVAARLDYDRFDPWEPRRTSPKVLELAAGLRDQALISQMLSADLELYAAVVEAIDRASLR